MTRFRPSGVAVRLLRRRRSARRRRAYGATSARTGCAATAAPTLVVDNSFTIKTSDPQRAFDPTASIVDRAIYDTLFTYKGGDLAHPIPLLVQSWKATKDAKTFTFQLKQNVHFADGTPLTSADVVFSLQRLINLKGNPSFLLAGVTVSAHGQVHGRPALGDAATALPAILANPSPGIVNSKLVQAARRHGRGRTPPRPTRRSSGSTRRPRPAPAAARTC